MKRKLVVQFYDEDDDLVAEEMFEAHYNQYDKAYDEAEEWAEKQKEDFGALYYQIS